MGIVQTGCVLREDLVCTESLYKLPVLIFRIALQFKAFIS